MNRSAGIKKIAVALVSDSKNKLSHTSHILWRMMPQMQSEDSRKNKDSVYGMKQKYTDGTDNHNNLSATDKLKKPVTMLNPAAKSKVLKIDMPQTPRWLTCQTTENKKKNAVLFPPGVYLYPCSAIDLYHPASHKPRFTSFGVFATAPIVWRKTWKP